MDSFCFFRFRSSNYDKFCVCKSRMNMKVCRTSTLESSAAARAVKWLQKLVIFWKLSYMCKKVNRVEHFSAFFQLRCFNGKNIVLYTRYREWRIMKLYTDIFCRLRSRKDERNDCKDRAFLELSKIFNNVLYFLEHFWRISVSCIRT